MKISEFPFHAKPRAQSEFGTARAVFLRRSEADRDAAGGKVPLEAADVQLVEVEERGGQRRVRAAGGENRRFSTGSARNGPHFLGAKKTRHAYKSDWGLRARRFSAILILRRSEADRDAAGGKVSLEVADVQLVEVEERGGQRRVRAAGGENRRFPTGSARNGPHFLRAKTPRASPNGACARGAFLQF